MSNPPRPVKRRSYRSLIRSEAAAATRISILTAARALFVEHGFEAMTMRAIAERAGVAVDTVYEVVGKKRLLARLLVETAISNTDQAIPAEQREYVKRIRAAPDARTKLAIYAASVVDIHHRVAPLMRALDGAAARHPDLGELRREISDRRARNMRLFAADLMATGTTRRELNAHRIADVLWALATPELYLMLVEQRGWSARDVEGWLADSWVRTLLEIERS